ncbi:MAG: DUF2630 family protein [Propionibacteriaceae bacterium]|jgi:predicted secreted protein|nr:DUF2630 family protein [Propionibacteriaceae bacterium]
MTTDSTLRERISALVDTEHDLRAKVQSGAVSATAEREELASIERELDQCWDLLRQRQAARDAGINPATARVRPADVVEGYLG